MSEHVVLVAIITEADSWQEAQEWIAGDMEMLRDSQPGSPDDENKRQGWWFAEDTRHDGSDNDSAVFVKPGNQQAARALLTALGIAWPH